MTRARYLGLTCTGSILSPQEQHEGWHYCWAFDDLLMRLGEDGCRCDPLPPVSMARGMQERSRTLEANGAF